jgi:hypothetical protein
MNISLLKQIITRLLQDPTFRQQFFVDPIAALTEYELSDTEEAYLLDITDNIALQEAAAALAVGDKIRGEETLEDTAAPPSPEGQLVSTGFAAADQPATPIDKQIPLTTAASHYFWLEIGAPVTGSIETSRVPLPDDLPDGAELQIALFPFQNELILTEGQDVGLMRLVAGGQAEVSQHAAVPPALNGRDTDILNHRLFFPVQTPAAPGTYRLRCNIYFQQLLLQSRLVTVQVAENPTPQTEPALRADMDYALSSLRNGRQLADIPPNTLSIMLNNNGSGTHGFRFFGTDQAELFKNDVTLDGNTLQSLIQKGRRALRVAAWGDDGPFTAQKAYKYAGAPNLQRLKSDLIYLARRGVEFYAAIAGDIAGAGGRKQRQLRQLLRPAGRIQIATKENARLLVPSAIIYDYKLDANLPEDQYTLCDAFVAALQDDKPLADTACFQGKCPHADELTTVCPSGFWGFRHEIGLPVSVEPGQDAPVTIPMPDGRPQLILSICTDPNFVLRDAHLQHLHQFGLEWQLADTRDETLSLLKTADSQVIYFYCHGGEADEVPYILVGDPRTETGITADNLNAYDIYWEPPRPQPLVFINGCHTTALEPDKALDFVTGFVRTSEAAGVVGTEITIFEAIAVAFAEECLRRFVIEQEPLGTAVRQARLNMLKQMNPLGLVYIPYAMPGLRLAKPSAAPTDEP